MTKASVPLDNGEMEERAPGTQRAMRIILGAEIPKNLVRLISAFVWVSICGKCCDGKNVGQMT